MYAHLSGALSLLLLASAWQGTSGQPCERGTRYKRGKCVTCRCYAGSEFNYTNIEKDLEMGYSFCPPCSQCPEGRYREPNSLFDTCKKCRKNCTADNKMWKTRCGNTSPGDCGNCMDGYVQGSIDSNSPCIKRTLLIVCSEGQYLDQGTCRECVDCWAQNRTTEVRCRGQSKGKCGPCLYGYVEMKTSKQCVRKPNTDEGLTRRQEDRTEHEDNNDVMIIVGIVMAGVVIVVITGSVSFWFVCRGESGQRCYKGRPTVTDGLDEAEAGKSSEAIFKETSDGGLDNDLAIDGPNEVHGELSETSPLVGNQDAMPVPDSRQYPVYIIKSDEGLGKEILKHIAKKIYDERVKEFFRYLGVGDEDIYPEHERYIKREQEYIDFKYNLLLKWIGMKGKQATLDVLCDALFKADFHTVLNDVLTMYKENSGRRLEAGECRGEVGVGIGPSTAHCIQYSDTFSGMTDQAAVTL